MNKKIENTIRYILCYAVDCGGKAYYQPCKDRLGDSDGRLSSASVNDGLRKYGSLHFEPDEAAASQHHAAWTYFEINDTGRNYLSSLEPKGLSRVLRQSASGLLSLIQLIPLTVGWLAYLLSWLAGLTALLTVLFVIGVPLDWISRQLWMGCDYLKHQLAGYCFVRTASAQRWEQHFPVI